MLEEEEEEEEEEGGPPAGGQIGNQSICLRAKWRKEKRPRTAWIREKKKWRRNVRIAWRLVYGCRMYENTYLTSRALRLIPFWSRRIIGQGTDLIAFDIFGIEWCPPDNSST